MSQVRKRKNKEKFSEETEKKRKKEDLSTQGNTSEKVAKYKVPNSLSGKLQKSSNSAHSKQKIKNCQTSDESRRKVEDQTYLSRKKGAKLNKANLHSFKIKDELNDYEDQQHSFNSSDSGIQSETFDLVKNKVKSSVTIKAEISKSPKYTNAKCNGGVSSSSESEWEEVEDHCETSLDDYKPNIPKEGVEITIDCPELQIRKRKKKQFDENEWIRLHINRIRKDIQLSMHKTHLLCLLSHGLYVNKILNSDNLKALALSAIPDVVFSLTSGKKIDKVDISGIQKIMYWFCQTFAFETDKNLFLNLSSSLEKCFEFHKSLNASEYNLMFIIIARVLGFKVRFCISLYPLSYKATNLIKKPNSKKTSAKEKLVKQIKNKDQTSIKCEELNKKKVKKETKISKLVKEKMENSNIESKKDLKKLSKPRRSKRKSYKISSDEEDNSDDEDFVMQDDISSDEGTSKSKKIHSKQKNILHKRKSNRKILSSDSEPPSPQSTVFEPVSIVCWAEIFSKPDKQWISVECTHKIVNKPYDIEVLAPQPVTYILAFDNESFVKDITRRYCNEYMTSTIKLRVDPDWWEDTLEPFLPPNSKLNKEEEKKLDEMLVNKPLPHTIQGFKNHPLYVLKRHLLKFEAIYPPDAPSVGFMRGEPVYARDCVHQLHSRETWLKEARVVRIGEQPYKIVKSRPKWDKIAGILRTDLPLEIFGIWQTEPYEPPIAVNGKVPRNEYGNVELFKACMLPKGTVHLQLPGLNRIAKKLGIDCSPAVIGFDGHKGSVHPVFDGFVICEEYKDTILIAWDEEQENAKRREEEKREKRIYGNWKKLIKGLLIRERIKLKYNTE